MFKLKYQNSQTCVEVEQPVAPSGADWEALIQFISRLESLETAKTPVSVVHPSSLTPVLSKASVSEEVIPTEIIRERLPNRDNGGNIIDINDLNVHMPTPGRAYKNFRCPKCGQSSMIITSLKKDVNYDYEQALRTGTLLVRDIVHDGKIFSVDLTKLDLERVTYEEACRAVVEEVVILSEDNETGENSCICCKCGAHESINDFIQAYLNPLLYFDYENPCPMCGEELCMSIDHDQQQVYKCENQSCIYVKEIEPE